MASPTIGGDRGWCSGSILPFQGGGARFNSPAPGPGSRTTPPPLSFGTAGQLLYALKLLTAHQHARTYWAELVVRELQRHRDKHIEELEKQAQALAGKLAGLAHRPLAMWEHLEEVEEDGPAATYVN